MPLQEEVGAHIQSYSIATMGTNLFGGVLPAAPDIVVAITQPRPGDLILAMSKTLDHVAEPFTITVRHTDPSLGYTMAWSIFNILNNFTGSLSGVRYLLILGRGIPFDIGPDENNRLRWSCDYWAHKDPS